MAEKVGRPLKFKNAKILEQKINEYFDFCDKKKKPYTVSGLALYLGCDRLTLINYEEREEFFNTVKTAKTRIENWIEENALSGDINTTMSIFNLKNNFGWKDKVETENTNTNDTTIKIKLEGELGEWAK